MKFISFIICLVCFAYIVNAKPLPDEDNSAENASTVEETSKPEETDADAEKVEATTKTQSRVQKSKSIPAETKSVNVIAAVNAPSSNPAQMEIKSWGPKDYEYSFKTENQRQAKTIHIEDKPEDKENPYDVSDTGSYSLSNEEHGYKYNVEYIAGSNGYRPKVSFSFHS